MGKAVEGKKREIMKYDIKKERTRISKRIN